jgi:hypothetical protein
MPTAASTHAPSAEAAGSSRPDRASPGSGRIPLWAGLAVFAAMFAYSWFGDHRQYVADDAGFSLRIGEGFAGTIAKTGQPLLVNDATTSPLVTSQFIRDRGIKARERRW